MPSVMHTAAHSHKMRKICSDGQLINDGGSVNMYIVPLYKANSVLFNHVMWRLLPCLWTGALPRFDHSKCVFVCFLRIIHKKYQKKCRKVWKFKNNAYLCSPFEKKRKVLRNIFSKVKEDKRGERELPSGNDWPTMRSLTKRSEKIFRRKVLWQVWEKITR